MRYFAHRFVIWKSVPKNMTRANKKKKAIEIITNNRSPCLLYLFSHVREALQTKSNSSPSSPELRGPGAAIALCPTIAAPLTDELISRNFA